MTVAAFELAPQLRGVQEVDAYVQLAHKYTDGSDRTYSFTQRVLTFPAGSSTAPMTDARLGSISRPTFALSDRRGQVQGVSLSFDLIDTDYFIRGWLENPFQDHLADVECMVWVTPADQRQAGYTPRPYFRGLVRGLEYPPDRMVRFNVEDPFTASFGENVAFPVVSKTDFPAAPNDSLGKTISPCYGDLSDNGVSVMGPRPIAEAASGMVVGPQWLGTPNPDDLAHSAGLFVDVRGIGGAFGHCPRTGYGSRGGTVLTGFTIAETANGLGDFSGAGTRAVRWVGMVTFTPDGGSEGDPDTRCPKDCHYIGPLGAEDSVIDMACTPAGVSGTYHFYLGWVSTGRTYVQWLQRIDTTSPAATFNRKNEIAGGAPSGATISDGGVIVGPIGGGRYYALLAVLADGTTSITQLAYAAQDGLLRPNRFIGTPVVGAVSYLGVRTRENAGASIPGTLTLQISPDDFDRQWPFPTSQVNGDGNPYFEDDLTDTTGEAIAGIDAPPPQGVVPGVDVGPRTDLNGVVWQMFLFAHGPVKSFVSGYINDVLVDESRFGQDVLLPGMTGYAQMSATPTIDVNGVTWSAGFLREDALATYQAASSPSFTAKLLGVADEDDALITDLLDQAVHVANNYTLTRTPYRSGAWLAPAAFSDSTLVVDMASVTAAQARLSTLLSSTAGAWFYRETVSAQQLHADLHLSAHVDGGWQPSGQYRLVVWDRVADTTRTFTERIDFVKGSFSLGRDDYSQLETVVPYQFRYDARTGTYERSATYRNVPAIAKRREKQLPDAPISFRMRRSASPCAEMATLRSMRYGNPIRLSPGTIAGLHAIDVLPGDCLALDHSEGTGPAGWTGRPVRVQDVSPDADGLSVGVLLEDYGSVATAVVVDDVLAEYAAIDQDVTFTASVSVSELGGGPTVSTGTVTFELYDGDDVLVGAPVTVPVIAGVATSPYTLPAGTGA